MEYIALAVDTLVVSGLYWLYKKKTQNLENVKKAIEFDPKVNNLEPGSSLDYAWVSGQVKPDGISLTSHFDKSRFGVIQIIQIKEHRTRLNNNMVSDSERIISRVVNHVPFSLVNEQLKVRVNVDQPLKADYILDSLNLTHTDFKSTKDSMLSKLVSIVFTDQHARGHETTEHMLPAGRTMTAFGRLERVLDSSSDAASLPIYQISQPRLDGHSYIVTSLSKGEIIEEMKGTSGFLKVTIFILGSVGVAIAAYVTYDLASKYLAKRNQRRMLERARQQREEERQRRRRQQAPAAQPAGQVGDNVTHQATCVVCLTNPREVVLVDCGHVCLCIDCLQSLPNRTCPICRRPFTSFVPCFIA